MMKKHAPAVHMRSFDIQKKISGPLLDRIDIQINVPRTKFENLTTKNTDSSNFKNQVRSAREIQANRMKEYGIMFRTNAELSSKECEEVIKLSDGANITLKEIFTHNPLSTRSYYRLLKTGRTIADLEGSKIVETPHITEAFQLRIREE